MNACLITCQHFTFTIDENVIWDVISNREQEFTSKRVVHHARV